MSLLQEIEQHGLADCEFNRTLLPDEISINWHFTDIQSVEITIEPEPSPRRVDDLEIKRNLLREKIKKSFLDLG